MKRAVIRQALIVLVISVAVAPSVVSAARANTYEVVAPSTKTKRAASVDIASARSLGTTRRVGRCSAKKKLKKGQARCKTTRTRRNQDKRHRGPRFQSEQVEDGQGASPSGTQGAIDWALAQRGRTDYNQWCLRFVANAFNRPFAGYANPVAMVRAAGVRSGAPPVGSLVMFGATPRNRHGHIGISLGGGLMVHAVRTVRVDAVRSYGPYLGWQFAPSTWPGRTPTNPAPQFIADGHSPPNAPSAPKPPSPPAGPIVPDRISGDQRLLASGNQFIRSKDGRFRFVMQQDSNLVLYGPSGRPLWASNTVGRGAHHLRMQGDGNLVIYTAANKPVWASGTPRHYSAFLVVQNDGNVVIYNGGTAIWSTRTAGRT